MSDVIDSPKDAIERAAALACDELGIEGDDRMLVEFLAQQPPMMWPACCDTGCTDCVKPVRRAAKRTLAILRATSDTDD